MKTFLLSVYEGARWPDLPADEKRRIARSCDAWHRDLVSRGAGRAAVGLHPRSSAVSVSDNEGTPVVTDGPFIETKEILGGFEIVACADQAEAVAIAKTFPALRAGFTLEVRPVMDDDDLDRMLNA